MDETPLEAFLRQVFSEEIELQTFYAFYSEEEHQSHRRKHVGGTNHAGHKVEYTEIMSTKRHSANEALDDYFARWPDGKFVGVINKADFRAEGPGSVPPDWVTTCGTLGGHYRSQPQLTWTPGYHDAVSLDPRPILDTQIPLFSERDWITLANFVTSHTNAL
jgi:hypothetical protein